MSIRNFATTAGIAAATLIAAGGVAFALGTTDVPTVITQPASVTTTAAPTTTSSPSSSATAVPVEEARTIAVAEVGGGEVTKVETEVEHGRLEWKVEVVRDGVAHDVRVDAESGAITRHDTDGSPSTATTAPSAPPVAIVPAPAPSTTYDDHHRNRGDDHGGRHGGDDRDADRSGHGRGGDDHDDDHGGRGRG
jgi:hypothetical protein